MLLRFYYFKGLNTVDLESKIFICNETQYFHFHPTLLMLTGKFFLIFISNNSFFVVGNTS